MNSGSTGTENGLLPAQQIQEQETAGTLCLKIGTVSCCLRLKSMDDYLLWKTLYGDFITDGPADLTIDLETTENYDPTKLSALVDEIKFSHNNNQFRTTYEVVSGQYDLSQKQISIIGEKFLIDPGEELNHLNRFIALSYYSACKIKYDTAPVPAMLVHCCSILRNGQAHVFAGPSGIGKTTLASLCGPGDGEVINDEMVLMSRPSPENGEVSIQGAPIIGGLPIRSDAAAPAGCIFLLKQGTQTRIRKIDSSEAYLKFIRQVVSPAYIGQPTQRSLYDAMADFSAAIVEHVPVYELEFSLDGKALWNAIAAIEK